MMTTSTSFVPSRSLRSRRRLAGELGFEPRLAESESAVLPLDDSPSALGAARGQRLDRRTGRVAQARAVLALKPQKILKIYARNCLRRLARLGCAAPASAGCAATVVAGMSPCGSGGRERRSREPTPWTSGAIGAGVTG